MIKPTRELADFAIKMTFDDLPESVVQKTKQVIFDSIGCALGAYVVDRSKIALELVEELGGKPQASVIGHAKTSWALAAFANGELINALDYDALGPFPAHVVSNVIPPCLAIGERVRASGKDLITAIALALEIGGRMMGSLAGFRIPKNEPPYYEYNPRISHANTIFGGVAGACKLLGLDSEKTANALGIAGASTPVPAGWKYQNIAGPLIMTKYNAWSGWVAKLATVASLLAEKGFTGDTTILDGDLGFWKIIGSPFFKVETLLGGLGKVWYVNEMIIKAYPCCGFNHAAVAAIIRIMDENGIKPEEIEGILVQGDPLMLTPNRIGIEVNNFSDTQFRNTYIYAVAAYRGHKPGPDWQVPSTFNDPKIRELMKKVKVVVHPNADEIIARMLREKWRYDTIVKLTAKGKEFTAETTALKGSPANPMTDTELGEKFKNNAQFSMLRTEKVDKVIEKLYHLENLDEITEMTRLLTIE